MKSQQGHGSEFTVHLDMPIVKNTTIQYESINDELFFNKHILLVEDHLLNLLIAKNMLEKKNMHVTCAHNGEEAIKLFEASEIGEFDIVLMDVLMPIMDGLQATKLIRSIKRTDSASIPIIAMSANSFDEDIKESLNAGMNEHLSKPINPQVLFETLQKYINK